MKRLCLVVDDEPVVRELVELILRTAGFEVVSAQNAAEGLAVVQRHADNLRFMVSDVRMPKGEEGVDLARAVRALVPNLPILLISGYSEADVTEFEFLNKPFTSEALLRSIDRITRQRFSATEQPRT